MNTPPPIRKPKTKPTALKPKPTSRKTSAPKKNFTVEPWTGAGEGKKILIYADFGMGKTTLASMLRNAAFIGVDDGGRLIKNPHTGADLMRVPQVETFQDVRHVLQTQSLFDSFENIVVDTITDVEKLALPYMFAHIPGPKGVTCTNIERYGYSKGYRHLYDTMRLPLQDCEPLVKAGKNIVFLAQKKNIKVANAAGDDYLKEAPSLYPGNATCPSIIDCYCEWVDYVFRIGYSVLAVEDKKVAGSTDRVIFTDGEVYYIAKHRTPLDAEIPFAEPSDDTIWRTLFDE